MLLPYRVKNPWKVFPYATVSLIALNVLVFFLTTEGLTIRESVVMQHAYRFGASSPLNMLWSMFLHADIFHIFGNMLFFWVFAPTVEDRLGVPKFLGLYFLTGLIGFLLQGMIGMSMGDALPSIGASGCVMGVLGAYWYLYPWSTVCVFYWFIVLVGTFHIAAFWIIGFYLAQDLVRGFLSGPSSGVAYFAHIGGGVSGALMCLLLRMPRDSGKVSQAKAVQSDAKELTRVPLHDLETMQLADPLNVDIIRAMIPQARSLNRLDKIHRAFSTGGAALLSADPGLVAEYLFTCDGDYRLYKPLHLIRVAHHLENGKEPWQAMEIYYQLTQFYPEAPENEVALYQLAHHSWKFSKDAPRARLYLDELVKRYPFGSMEQHAQLLRKKMDQPGR